ncbi:pentapeptide repeat-containing protein [Nostoc sp. DedSLP04]|uniref:pentapeptide repeat-containing protein n=1 Tax=Nostoc sp. DedSLP04 TaxID=3075401 RepID=UPI002AD56381|nr:pentapeptide repeat-containing protein [Nostoc sp. DedSLP04]MDZ8034944.1 pentapeptide repeat-containing protein [Nostoc sp. DedSLP04]
MVNEEHYARLNKGVQAWNKWIANNLSIIVDLIGADLSDANLSDANLSRANLSDANLSRANLSDADLSDANLSRANLIGANLSGAYLGQAKLEDADFREAYLIKADFFKADLNNAVFNGADVRETQFSVANLVKADLSGLDLSGAYFCDADLNQANLSRADLTKVILIRANLTNANLTNANLSEADLREANLTNASLTNANLSEADLREANLTNASLTNANLTNAYLPRTQALKTDFTNAKFTGTCLEDWNINFATKLDDIDCQYIYLKINKQERRPSSGEFAPGEFSKLFQKALETVDLIFTDGIDWKAFLLSFKELQAEYGEENLSVQAIEKKNGGAFVIRLEVPLEANKADIESQAKALYEIQLNALETIYRNQLKAKDVQIEIYHQENANLWELVKLAASKPIQIKNTIDVTAKADNNSMVDNSNKQSTFNLQDAQFAGGLVNADTVNAQQIGGNITNYTPEQKQNLASAASEIQQLLYQLAQTNLTTTDAITEAIHQEIKRNPKLKARLISALKAGGLEALKAIFNHPLFNIPVETIKGFLEAN